MLIRILLVNDHTSVAFGMKLMLEKDFQVMALNLGEKALALIEEKEFDIFIFDLKMPEMDGHELAKIVVELNPKVKIIIYTGYKIEPYFIGLFSSGVMEYLIKTDSEQKVIETIRSLLNNDATIPVHLLQLLRESGLQMESVFKNLLTPEEVNILEQVAIGKTNKEIADCIFKSTRTVEKDLTSVFQKLKVKSRKDALARARELILMSPDVECHLLES